MSDIPDDITGSWYRGQVFVLLKDTVFEPSSPFRHACELYHILQSVSFSKPVLFLYSDGGPDHRLTYVSVQLSLICLFLKMNLDFLCAGRTAPYHSWRNPVERIMSILNLGQNKFRLVNRLLVIQMREIASSFCPSYANFRVCGY